MSAGHVFADETKARDYLLVAAVLLPSDMNDARRMVSSLMLRGQTRVHMKKESSSRRKRILTEISQLKPQVTIYRAGNEYRTELERRERCLHALVADLARAGHKTLCLERDDSLVSRDRQHLIEATRNAGCTESLVYRHESATSEPLLAIPDAIAWAWAKGGDWRSRCEPVVLGVVNV